MPIKSYLCYPQPELKEEIIKSLKKNPRCEIELPNKEDVFILITDTLSEDEDKKLYEDIKSLDGIDAINLINAFSEESILETK